MHSNGDAYDWRYFRLAMMERFLANEPQCRPMLELIGECDEIVTAIVSRPMSYSGQRPQDFVTGILVTRSFRLAISAIHVSLTGYGDSVPNLCRTILEIALRLQLIIHDPVAASLGFLLYGAREEIKSIEAGIRYFESKGLGLGNLLKNLETMQGYERQLEEIIRSHRLSPHQITKTYGRLSPFKILEDLGMENIYKVSYGFYSGFVHETGQSMDETLDQSIPGEMRFVLSPLPAGSTESIYDVLHDLVMTLALGAHVVASAELETRCEQLLQKLEDASNSSASEAIE